MRLVLNLTVAAWAATLEASFQKRNRWCWRHDANGFKILCDIDEEFVDAKP